MLFQITCHFVVTFFVQIETKTLLGLRTLYEAPKVTTNTQRYVRAYVFSLKYTLGECWWPVLFEFIHFMSVSFFYSKSQKKKERKEGRKKERKKEKHFVRKFNPVA